MNTQSKIRLMFLTGMLVGTVLTASINFATQRMPEEHLPQHRMSAADIVKRFNQIYYNNEACWIETKWLGINAWQNPCDNWIMQEIISEIKPDVIIETGTYKGGASLFYASILNYVNKDGKIITVDVNPQIEEVSKNPLFQNYVEVLKGDSVSPEIIDIISRRVKDGDKVLVTLDSLHTKDHVMKELELYSKFVSVGSYLVVQDTNINGHPVLPEFGPGPMEAMIDFLEENRSFKIDTTKNKFLLTSYPLGFLKKAF
jgi:cephalosporin hydroxylase